MMNENLNIPLIKWKNTIMEFQKIKNYALLKLESKFMEKLKKDKHLPELQKLKLKIHYENCY